MEVRLDVVEAVTLTGDVGQFEPQSRFGPGVAVEAAPTDLLFGQVDRRLTISEGALLLVDEHEGVAAVSRSPKLGSVRPSARCISRWYTPLDVLKIRLNVKPQRRASAGPTPALNAKRPHSGFPGRRRSGLTACRASSSSVTPLRRRRLLPRKL
jgi:hypothetical protein